MPRLNPYHLTELLSQEDLRPRRYTIPPVYPSTVSSDSYRTSPFPHPLKPLEYWRTFAENKAELLGGHAEECRQRIPDSAYWRIEADFWAPSDPSSRELGRQLEMRG